LKQLRSITQPFSWEVLLKVDNKNYLTDFKLLSGHYSHYAQSSAIWKMEQNVNDVANRRCFSVVSVTVEKYLS
jgi:hypothetical protein